MLAAAPRTHARLTVDLLKPRAKLLFSCVLDIMSLVHELLSCT